MADSKYKRGDMVAVLGTVLEVRECEDSPAFYRLGISHAITLPDPSATKVERLFSENMIVGLSEEQLAAYFGAGDEGDSGQ